MSNKFAVITGASSGMGAEFARQLSKMGYELLLIARRRDRLVELAGNLETKADIFVCDVAKEDDCDSILAYIGDRKVDIFLNNAGFGDCGYFPETDLDRELNMIDVNVRALHYLMKGILRKMLPYNDGYLLNIASSAGILPGGPYMATYYASKAYVKSISVAVNQELLEANSNVYVGCLCPGPVDTEFNQTANVEFALKGISVEYCVSYALKQMFKRKVIIIPSALIKGVYLFNRICPLRMALRMTSRQQKKKLGR